MSQWIALSTGSMKYSPMGRTSQRSPNSTIDSSPYWRTTS
jgi:hypothetical protein